MESTIYNAKKSANQILDKQAIIANNLANVSTTGFKEKFFLNIQKNQNTKKNVHEKDQINNYQYYNLSSGTPKYTNRNLDIYIQKNGWLAVKDQYGQEAYTKNGHLVINSQGELTVQNYIVIGEHGTINIPKKYNIKILSDGTIIHLINKKNHIIQSKINKLKLVSSKINTLKQKENGLFYVSQINQNITNMHNLKKIKLISGMLETSNVNPTKNMIEMISNARQFDMQMKIISVYDKNSEYANQLLDINN